MVLNNNQITKREDVLKKAIITIMVQLIVLFALAIGCDSGEGKSDLEECLNGCTKAYEECAQEYMDLTGADEAAVAELRAECEENCQDEADDASDGQTFINCVRAALEGVCSTLFSQIHSRYRSYENCYDNCVMALDCEDFLQGQFGDCNTECETQLEAAQQAEAEFYYSCEKEYGMAAQECDGGGGGEDCATGCPDDWLGDGYCDDTCNNADCNYDLGDCGGGWECAPGCTKDMLANGSCDGVCNVAECYYDFGDC
jgi:hypothetical protein